MDIAITASSPEADEVVAEIAQKGVRCAYYSCNVKDGGSVTETVKKVIADFGKIDILVNNAGVTADKLLIAMSESDFDKVLAVNLKGAFLVQRRVCASLLKTATAG